VSQLLQDLNLAQFAEAFEKEMVGSVRLGAMLSREEFKDMGIPEGAMVLIMAQCRELMQG
jgi:hypothetical protein